MHENTSKRRENGDFPKKRGRTGSVATLSLFGDCWVALAGLIGYILWDEDM